jgi:hypothetical protein
MTTQLIRAYVDTCVFDRAFDEEFAVPMSLFFTEVRLGRLQLIVSPVVTDEIQLAPHPVRELYQSLLDCITIVDPDERAFALQGAYLAARDRFSKVGRRCLTRCDCDGYRL